MPKPMPNEKKKEFEELSKFLEYYFTNQLGINKESPIHPTNVLNEIKQKHGWSTALKGLQQAINDTIEDTQELSLNEVQQIDSTLTNKGIISLSELRRRYWSKYRKIIKNNKITNETEYYLVIGLLNDISSQIKANERAQLSEFVEKFEKNV